MFFNILIHKKTCFTKILIYIYTYNYIYLNNTPYFL